MKQRQYTETVVDDLDKSSEAETRKFTVDGKEYEIDLNDEHDTELGELLDAYSVAWDALEPYVEVARRVRQPADARKKLTPASDSEAIRKWAAENGIEVGARGRIPNAIQEQYHAAQGAKKDQAA